MSKIRPRADLGSPSLPPLHSAQRRPKVFHNTYTWKGRNIAVRGWSVKIQHQGRRCTFSLKARTKAGAAAEAEELYTRLLTDGWEMLGKTAPSGGDDLAKTEVRYWKERLLIRKGHLPAASDGRPTFCAYINHAGVGYYFPLGLSDCDQASAKALAIYQTIINRGWKTACQIFPREVCIAFHWASEPLLWTYTTVQTMPQGSMEPALPVAEDSGIQQSFVLAEADRGVRCALARHLTRQPGRRCIAVSDVEAACAQSERSGAVFCLISADLQNKTGLPLPSGLTALPGGVPALTYSVHLDSDAAFIAPRGGISSYLYKRLPPDDILEPVQTILNSAPASFDSFRLAAESYFRSVLKITENSGSLSATSLLTQREQQVLNLLCKGYIDKEIAAALCVSPWTVHGHLKHVFAKLNVHSRIEAVLWGIAK